MAYTKLKYIESNGTQYIDTGFKPNQDTRVVCDFSHKGGNVFSIFGGRTAYQSTDYSFWMNGGSWLSNYNVLSESAEVTTTDNRYVVDKDKNVTSISGATMQSAYGSFQSPYNMYLFNCNNSNVADTRVAPIKMYSCQIYDNETLVRDYIPMANEKGVCGLYDNVNGVFYPSANGNNFFGVREDNGLPVGYTLCEYIESNGTQYVDTGFKPNNNTRIDMSASLFNVEGDQYFYGSKDSSSQKSYVCAFSKPDSMTVGYGAQFLTSTFSLSEGEVVNIVQDKYLLYVNGTILSTAANVTFQTPSTLYLCARNNNDTLSKLTRLKIYSCRLYDNGTLIRDFVPVVDNNGMCGLWDKANDIFYTSPNGNNFVGYIEGQELPTNFKKCEYIESNGTQYINTGFVANQDSRITVDCSFLATTAEQRLFGARTAWAVDEFVLLARSNKYEYRYGNQTVALESSPISDRYIVDADRNIINFNGEVKTATSNNFSTVVPVVLFAYNDNGSVYDFAKARIYSCQIYNNEVLVRDYIPVMRNDGVCGLWDKIENKFYMSANGNNFIGKIDISELPIGYTLCEYIESDGSQYIDTHFKPSNLARVVMECETTGVTSSSNRWLFGSSTSATSARFELINIASDNSIRFYHGATNQTFSGVGLGHMNIDVSLSSASVNGVSITPTSSTFTGTNSMLLCNGQTTGEVYDGMPMKVYYCQIYDNGMLVRDYVPCQDMYGVYGLYDLANNVFYQSASDYGFTGKWLENKKLYISPKEWMRRLIMSNDNSFVSVVYNFSYTGAVQMAHLNKGKYLLEVWGAQGGNAYVRATGGRGGYSYGEVTIDAATTMYVVVGGKGGNSTSRQGMSGGYNGGGKGGDNSGYDGISHGGAGGGGATHIATSSGLLASLSSVKNSIYIVAGGGGGASGTGQGGSSESVEAEYSAYGGAGGGTTGVRGAMCQSSGWSEWHGSGGGAGTQSTGGAGGLGRKGNESEYEDGVYSGSGGGGGGGGYYGGGGGAGGGTVGWYSSYKGGNGYQGTFGIGGNGGFGDPNGNYASGSGGAGGGGSGYLSASLASASTMNGDEYFLSPDGVTEKGHSGNGYARITKIK